MEVKSKVSAIVIAKNEEKKIGKCLNSLLWTDEIIVVDTGSVDKTVSIAKSNKAFVIKTNKGGFKDWRNLGASKATGDWLFYVDSDERVAPELAKEIKQILLKDSEIGCYAVPRKNIIFGREMKHGGWWPDYVKRLIKKDKFKKWVGDLHENPTFNGKLGYLKNPLIHHKHDSISEMVEKTNKWSVIEARLLFESGHPKMVWWRFLRIMATELFYRLFYLRGLLDGVEGIVYAIYQMWSRFVTYAKLWEMQQQINDK